ncbi:D-xylose ABC transporter substrate-binding protein [Cohnella thailandensis]|uniref:D-xylose ABC transporter substrate-binding protein n=1 Tax=Cohnella thailandensis TaxID=557557 RepID=A0A841T183_9BACL|nr:D-xylose ABC transporter substrate-binding protein [Cohnella thailandensis]MBB6635840.1 D-xylose ABC transporter substrate-binding protein [Cohnella thailandensis]MBP1976218.1 D-xylose transport system substrate-binding protein [Cohnella thailandensis]
MKLVSGGKRRLASLNVHLLLLLLAFVLAACEGGSNGKTKSIASPSATEGGGGGEEEPITIGFSMDTLLEERWLKDRDMFRAAGEARGANVVIMEANGDDAKQISQAETMISQGVDILVIAPHNAEATAAIVKKAHSAGIKVLAYDRLIKNSDVDLYVSFDNEMVGELQARAITRLVPKGKYVYIGGADTDNNAHLFKAGVFNVLQPLIDRGDITVVYDQWTKDWTPANALVNMKQALDASGDQIDAVIAANDATAGSVIEALAEAGLAGKIPVAGQDADLAAAQRIVAGTQTMTVYKPIKLLADKAADLAVKLARGEDVQADKKLNNGKIEVPSVLLTPIAVDRSNLEDTIISDGFHSREDVYKK